MKRLVCKVISCSILFLLLVSADNVNGTEIIKLNLKELTDKSGVIIVGRNVDTTSKWDKDKKIISTYVSYQIEDVVKGNVDKKVLVVKSLGGTVQNITQATIDGPRFEPGTKELLFLKEGPEAGTFQIVGFNQGKFPVKLDSSTGEEIIFIEQDEDSFPDEVVNKKGSITKKQRLPVSLNAIIKKVRGKNEK